MRARQLRTKDYPEPARIRLGEAVAKAREATGHKYRTTFARAAGIKSVRSLEMLELGDPGVGQSVLFAVGRYLPNWTEDTPRVILEGGPIPPPAPMPPAAPEPPKSHYPDGLQDDVERQLWDIKELGEDDKWTQIYVWRAKKAERLRALQEPPNNTHTEQFG